MVTYNDVMRRVQEMSDRELRQNLVVFDPSCGPVMFATRRVYAKKLARFLVQQFKQLSRSEGATAYPTNTEYQHTELNTGFPLAGSVRVEDCGGVEETIVASSVDFRPPQSLRLPSENLDLDLMNPLPSAESTRNITHQAAKPKPGSAGAVNVRPAAAVNIRPAAAAVVSGPAAAENVRPAAAAVVSGPAAAENVRPAAAAVVSGPAAAVNVRLAAAAAVNVKPAAAENVRPAAAAVVNEAAAAHDRSCTSEAYKENEAAAGLNIDVNTTGATPHKLSTDKRFSSLLETMSPDDNNLYSLEADRGADARGNVDQSYSSPQPMSGAGDMYDYRYAGSSYYDGYSTLNLTRPPLHSELACNGDMSYYGDSSYGHDYTSLHNYYAGPKSYRRKEKSRRSSTTKSPKKSDMIPRSSVNTYLLYCLIAISLLTAIVIMLVVFFPSPY